METIKFYCTVCAIRYDDTTLSIDTIKTILNENFIVLIETPKFYKCKSCKLDFKILKQRLDLVNTKYTMTEYLEYSVIHNKEYGLKYGKFCISFDETLQVFIYQERNDHRAYHIFEEEFFETVKKNSIITFSKCEKYDIVTLFAQKLSEHRFKLRELKNGIGYYNGFYYIVDQPVLTKPALYNKEQRNKIENNNTF